MKDHKVCITNGAALCADSKRALREIFGSDTVFANEGDDCEGYVYKVAIPNIQDSDSVDQFIADARKRLGTARETVPGYMLAATVIALGVVAFGVVKIVSENRDPLRPART